nr:hypothetical protein [uncultured Halomonas sp.]
MRAFGSLSLVLLLLAGCSYTPARIDPEPVIEVGDGHHDHRNGGDFCPPGQAKKGRC